MRIKKYHPARKYFIPHHTRLPIVGSIGLFFFMIGLINIIHGKTLGHYVMFIGILLIIYMIYKWFGTVIEESLAGKYSAQMDRTYRWGMAWFIVSEIFFFSIFFGALFYIRLFALPQLAGTEGSELSTHQQLWPNFQDVWPLLNNPNPKLYPGPKEAMGAWGIPALNTFILLSSAVAVTFGHWGLKQNNRRKLLLGLIITIFLGLIFLCLQVYEYYHAVSHYKLTLNSGIYGSTFYMLTGFHGAHVTIGLIMLSVILLRAYKNHFLPDHHFAYEAVAWYWHFVDVVWLFLFVFVYWL